MFDNQDNILESIRIIFDKNHGLIDNIQDNMLDSIPIIYDKELFDKKCLDHELLESIHIHNTNKSYFLLLEQKLQDPIKQNVFTIMADNAINTVIEKPRRISFEKMLNCYQKYSIILFCFFSRLIRKYHYYVHTRHFDNVSLDEMLKRILIVLKEKHPEQYRSVFKNTNFVSSDVY